MKKGTITVLDKPEAVWLTSVPGLCAWKPKHIEGAPGERKVSETWGLFTEHGVRIVYCRTRDICEQVAVALADFCDWTNKHAVADNALRPEWLADVQHTILQTKARAAVADAEAKVERIKAKENP